MTQPKQGLLIVISGPSGVGKDTVLRRLFELAPHLKYSVSYTTRAPRPGEVDGHSYTFVTQPEFLRLIEQKEFLEWARVYDEYYGTSRRRVEEALSILPKEKVWVDPDCGLKTRTVEEAIEKLRVCVTAAKAFRN